MPSLNLTRDEAAARAALITVHACDVHLDLTGAEADGATTFGTVSEIAFDCGSAGADTFLDFIGASVEEVTLNGTALDVADVVDGQRIHLRSLAAENVVRVRATGLYSRSGEGLHRFVDPADGRVYLYTQNEPADCCRWIPVFEQPDLKARFTMHVDAPADWVVRGNGAEVASSGDSSGDFSGTVRHFAPTEPISTYLVAVLAGPYHQADAEHTVTTPDGPLEVPMAVFCRASLAEHLDADRIADVTRAGLDHYQERFGVPYPFGKYDQAFVPEYNLGAMENPGLVTFTEAFVFRTEATEIQYQGRANVIMHEMAHMWFGDLVTMRWWDDLWLKESFADFMGSASLADTGLYPGSWVTFANRRKAWAYVQDALPTTHPIVADIVDLDAAKQNFDGITYAKGASALKQLVAFVGQEAFDAASRAYFREHAWGNTTLADFLAALSEASGRDMGAWAAAWLQTAGISTIAVERPSAGDTVRLRQSGTDPVTGEPAVRPHALVIGAYREEADGRLRASTRVPAELAAATVSVSVPGAADAPLLLPNDGDLTYATVALDPESLATVLDRIEDIDDEMARTVCWSALWAMTRDAALPAERYVRTVARAGASETDDGVRQMLFSQALTAVIRYTPPGGRRALLDVLLGALADQVRTTGSLTFARLFAVAAAHGGGEAELLDALANEPSAAAASLEPLVTNQDLRWSVLVALAARDAVSDDRIAAELARDETADGRRQALTARSARPGAAVKQRVWDSVTGDESLSNELLSASLRGFALTDAATAEPFTEPYFASVSDWWEGRSIEMASRLVRGLFPPAQELTPGTEPAEHPVVVRAGAWLDANPDAPAALRRILVEEQDGLLRALRAQAAASGEVATHAGPYVPNELLSRLIGDRMYSVEFVVNDYVQLRFDGSSPASGPVVLNCYVWPVVEADGRLWREPDLGYADALRQLCPGTVTATSEATGSGIRIELDTGAVVLHPAREDVFVEIAELSGFADRAWMVWRPGEECFEDLR
ncbi:aminopeptidase N [Tersicoccus sp. MR15.9]|uniref:aminopeptidase N n=1 Tax=Tersicoccus mangrovi TaxID=3121635 RepID=UPI002FE5AF69